MMPTGELTIPQSRSTSDRDLTKAVVSVLADGSELNITQLSEALFDRGVGVSLAELYREIERMVEIGRMESRYAWIAGESGQVRPRRLVRLKGVPFVSQADLQTRVRLDSLDAEAKAEMMYAERDEDRIRRARLRIVDEIPTPRKRKPMPRLVKYGIPFVAAGVLIGAWAAWPEAHPAILFLSVTVLLIACTSSIVAGPKPPEPK